MPTEPELTIVLCRRCKLCEVDDEQDLCGECLQELIQEGWNRWFDRRAKETRWHY